MANNNSSPFHDFFARFKDLLEASQENIPTSYCPQDEVPQVSSGYCEETKDEDHFPPKWSHPQEDAICDRYSELFSQPTERLPISSYSEADVASLPSFPLLACQQAERLWVNRYVDPETGSIPLLGKRPPTMLLKSPPDISNGLGKRQEAMDTAALEAFVVSQAQWMIYEGCLCIYRAPCWHKFENDNEAIKEIRQLLYRHGEIRESLTISDYRKIYSGLLSNPELEAPTRLDTPPYTINCVDGTLNLLTLQPHAHCPEDHFFYYFELSWRDVVNPPMRGEYFDTFVAQISNGNPAAAP